MKVLTLRTHQGIAALKGENSWNADEHTGLRVLANGDYIVSRHSVHVRVPAAAVQYARVEPDEAIAEVRKGKKE